MSSTRERTHTFAFPPLEEDRPPPLCEERRHPFAGTVKSPRRVSPGTICFSPIFAASDDVMLPDKDELDIFSDIWRGIETGAYEVNGYLEDDPTKESELYSNGKNETKSLPRAYKKARLDDDDTPHKKPATPPPKRAHEIPMSPLLNQYSLPNKVATFLPPPVMAPVVSPSPIEKTEVMMETPKQYPFQPSLPPLVEQALEMQRMPDIFDAEDERKARAAPPEFMEDISHVFDDVYDKLYWKAVQKTKEDEERRTQEQEMFQKAVENAKRTYVPSPTCLRVMANERKKEENARKKEEARLAKKVFQHPPTPMATTGIMDPMNHRDNIVNVKHFGMMI
eukprot:scaffold33460_cov54-Attheya_sp.AAC.1